MDQIPQNYRPSLYQRRLLKDPYCLGKNNMPSFNLLPKTRHIVMHRSFCTGKVHTQKPEKLTKKISPLGNSFPELVAWRCLRKTCIKNRSNLQLPFYLNPCLFLLSLLLLLSCRFLNFSSFSFFSYLFACLFW